jgi:hypothetical protein
MRNIEHFHSKNGMSDLAHIFKRVIQDLGNVDYELKTEAIILIRCLILPSTVTSDVYKPFKKDIFTFEEKVQVLFCIDIQMFTGYKEAENQGFKLFSNYYWELVLDFVESNQCNFELNETFRKFYLVGLKAVKPVLKDRLLTILNDFNYSNFNGKFHIMLNPEYENSNGGPSKGTPLQGGASTYPGTTQENKIDFVKKICPLNACNLSKHGEKNLPLINSKKQGVIEFGNELIDSDFYQELKTKSIEEHNSNICVAKYGVNKGGVQSNLDHLRDLRLRSASIDFDAFTPTMNKPIPRLDHGGSDKCIGLPKDSAGKGLGDVGSGNGISNGVMTGGNGAGDGIGGKIGMDTENLVPVDGAEKNAAKELEINKYFLKNPKERVASYIYELNNVDEASLFDSCRELIE